MCKINEKVLAPDCPDCPAIIKHKKKFSLLHRKCGPIVKKKKSSIAESEKTENCYFYAM